MSGHGGNLSNAYINETLKARDTPGHLSYELSSAFRLFTAISPKLGRNYLLGDMAGRMCKVLAESDHACMDPLFPTRQRINGQLVYSANRLLGREVQTRYTRAQPRHDWS